MDFLEKLKLAIQRKLIVAGPELTEPLDTSSYDIPEENKKIYRRYTKTRGTLIHTIAPNIKLYHNKSENSFFVFDDTDKIILYHMIYETHTIFGHEFAVQRFIWASGRMGKPEMKIKGQSVTVFVFLNLLMRVAGGIAIATDAFHSPDGRRFWLRRIAQAFSDKKHVYLIDIEKNIKVKVHTDKEFEQKMNEMKMWVKSEKGQERRVIISSTPIKW